MVHDPYIRIYVYIYVGLLRSTDSKTANTRLGATKPQTKANTTATRVSRGSKRGVSSAREGWNYQGIVARLQSGGEQTFSNWTRVIIRRRTFSTFSSNWKNFDERSYAFPPTRGSSCGRLWLGKRKVRGSLKGWNLHVICIRVRESRDGKRGSISCKKLDN